jgi:hypothetical protein
MALNGSPDGSTPTRVSTSFVYGAALEDRAVDERLGDRLDGERDTRVTDLVHVAVCDAETNGKPIRVGPAELGDVAGHFAGVGATERIQQVTQIGLQRRPSGIDARHCRI